MARDGDVWPEFGRGGDDGAELGKGGDDWHSSMRPTAKASRARFTNKVK